MSNINNQWVRENQSLVYRLLRDIEEYEMQGSYGGALNLTMIRKVISGLFKEVNNLQDQVELMKAQMMNKDNEYKKLEEELNNLKTKMGS